MYISSDYQEAVVKCLNAYTVPEDMVHNLKVFTVPFLTDREHKKGNKEIDRAVINLPALTFFFPSVMISFKFSV